MQVERGAVVRQWKPLPRGKCVKLATRSNLFVDFLRAFILFAAFGLSVFMVAKAFGRPAPLYRDPVWWLTFTLLVVVPFWVLHAILNAVHRKRRLVVYEHAVGFGSSCLWLDDIDLVSSGSQQGISEKYFGSLEKVALITSSPLTAKAKVSAATKERQRVRDHSLTLMTSDGKLIHWVGLLALFSKKDIDQFFELLLAKAPHIRIGIGSDEDAK